MNQSAQNQNTKKLLQEMEKLRETRLLVYFTGDGRPFGAQMSDDAIRPLYDHLLNMNIEDPDKGKIDLFLYSPGGDVSVPWRLVSMIREFCAEFNVLIPYKAYSAATLLSLGADAIVMGKKAELGPIDPSLRKPGDGAKAQQQIDVEDVISFVSFIKERANIRDQDAVSRLIGDLANKIGALTLGKVHREYHHIRLVARKLITSRGERIDEERISTTIETLTEKMYSHGHGIGRKEAKDIGLPVVEPPAKIEELMWELYLEYESMLKLQSPLDLMEWLGDEEEKEILNQPVGVIESTGKLHIHESNIKVRKKRKIPPNPQINFQVGLQLPPQLQSQQIPQQIQQLMQQCLQQISQKAPKIIQEELKKQSPIIGLDINPHGGGWHEKR